MTYLIPHECHARGCRALTPRRWLCCPRHWRMIPKTLQDAVVAAYEPGQHRSARVTLEYLRAARAALDSIPFEKQVAE